MKYHKKLKIFSDFYTFFKWAKEASILRVPTVGKSTVISKSFPPETISFTTPSPNFIWDTVSPTAHPSVHASLEPKDLGACRATAGPALLEALGDLNEDGVSRSKMNSSEISYCFCLKEDL